MQENLCASENRTCTVLLIQIWRVLFLSAESFKSPKQDCLSQRTIDFMTDSVSRIDQIAAEKESLSRRSSSDLVLSSVHLACERSARKRCLSLFCATSAVRAWERRGRCRSVPSRACCVARRETHDFHSQCQLQWLRVAIYNHCKLQFATIALSSGHPFSCLLRSAHIVCLKRLGSK